MEKSFASFDTTSWSLSIRFLVSVTSTELKYLEQLNKWTTKISFRRQIKATIGEGAQALEKCKVFGREADHRANWVMTRIG